MGDERLSLDQVGILSVISGALVASASEATMASYDAQKLVNV